MHDITQYRRSNKAKCSCGFFTQGKNWIQEILRHVR